MRLKELASLLELKDIYESHRVVCKNTPKNRFYGRDVVEKATGKISRGVPIGLSAGLSQNGGTFTIEVDTLEEVDTSK